MRTLSYRHCLYLNPIDREYHAFGTPPFSPHWSGETYAVQGVVGTLGTADTGGTAQVLSIGVDPSTGAMYVNNIGAGGGGGTAGTNVNIVTGTINSGTVVGNAASGASDAGNPVKVGGVYNGTQPTVTTGQRVDFQTDNRGNHMVYLATKLDAANDAVTIGSQIPAGTNIIGNVGTLVTGTILALASGTITGGTVQNLVSGTINAGTFSMTSGTLNVGTVVNNGGSVQITDNTNIVNVMNTGTGSNGSALQNALLTAGGYMQVIGTASSAVDFFAGINVSNYNWVSVQVSGTFVGTVTFRGCNDNANYGTIALEQSNSTTGGASSIATSNLIYHGPLSTQFFKTTMTSYTSGTAFVTCFFSTNTRALQALSVNTVPNVGLLGGGNTVGNIGTLITGTLAALASGTITTGTVVNNGGSVQIYDSSGSIANILTANGTTTGQNAQLVAGQGFFVGTVNLSSGTQNSTWYDMLNYSWVSVGVLNNTTAATLSFQTAADPAQTNGVPIQLVASNSSGPVTSTTNGSFTYHGPRAGRYFRVSTALAGTNVASIAVTLFSNPSQYLNQFAAQSGAWSVTLNSKPGSQILSYGTSTTGTIGTLVAAPGVGTSIYVTSYAIDGDVTALGTPDIVFGFGTVQNGTGVIFRGGLPTTTPFGQSLSFPISANLTNTPLTFMQLAGGGTVAFNVSYFVQ